LAILIECSSRSYLRFEDLKFYRTKWTNLPWSAALNQYTAGTDRQVVDCVFDEIGNSGTAGSYNTYGYCGGCVVTNARMCGLRISGKYFIEENNTVTGNGTETYRGIGGGRLCSIIRNNTVRDIIGVGPPPGASHSDSIDFTDGGADDDNDYWWMYGNVIDNFVEGIPIYGSVVPEHGVIHSNLFICRVDVTGKGDAAILMQGGTGILIYNNTFVGVQNSPYVLGRLPAGCLRMENYPTDAQDVQFKNNLCIGDDGIAVNVGTDQGTGFVSEGNHYYITGASLDKIFWYTGTNEVLADWQARGFDDDASGFHYSNGIGVDPLVEGFAALDFSLSSLSPDIDAGEDLSAYFTLDAAGNVRTAPYDVGAFEYQAGGSPPGSTTRNVIFYPGGVYFYATE